MAKKVKHYRPKRKGHRKGHSFRRRRRVGATALNFSATSPLVQWGSVALGYFFGDKVLSPLKKMIPASVDGKIIGVVEGGLGYMLALRKGKKNMLQVVGGGLLLGDAVKTIMSSFGVGGIGPYGRVPVIAGSSPYGNVPVIAGRRRMNGFSPNGTLNGFTPNGTISKVLTGVNPGSGSGVSSNVPGSDLMS